MRGYTPVLGAVLALVIVPSAGAGSVAVQDLGATIFQALDVPLEQRLGRDGFTRPVSTGQPLLDLFGS